MTTNDGMLEDGEEDVAVTFVGEFHVSELGDTVFSGSNIELAVEDRLLLTHAHLSLQRGHRYGLIGENGAGKTTLLQALRAQIEQENASFSVQYVGQTDAERNAACEQSVREYCTCGNARRAALLSELEELEASLGDDDGGGDEAANAAERIGELLLELEEQDGSDANERADRLLRQLGFSPAMRGGSVSRLSGGWRTRLELARALFAEPSILFLDEPTNHLDLHAVFQLAGLLRSAKAMTCIIVSHDAAFLDLVATDILSINGCQLQSLAGNYAVFEEKAAEYRRFHEHIYDNRQREEARQQVSTGQQRITARRAGNDKALKQAASRERKAQERTGLYREDGKKFKLFSLKTMDAKSVRLPSRASALQKQRTTKISLPKVHLQGKLRGGGQPLLELRSACLRYPPSTATGGAAAPRRVDLLADLDAQVYAGDRIALVGANGAGKSTLLRALAGDASPAVVARGEVRRFGRIAVVDQNQLALLDGHLEESSVDFLLRRHAGSSLLAGGDPDARKHLGQFGLSGDLALLPIGALSGGLRVRLVLADVFADDGPLDVLLLDEPTNHLDGETIAALAAALQTFPGAVVAVSHNCAFLLEVCKDLWVGEGGTLRVEKETDGCLFVDNFRAYAEQIVLKSEKEALHAMLRNRAARAAIVVQQPGATTSLLV